MSKTNTNRKADKLTFHQWLNGYECITKREFKEFPDYKKENYKSEYEEYLKSEE